MSASLLVEERLKIAVQQQVDGDKLAGLPVAGNLQHRRAGKAAMGKQQIFAEQRTVLGGNGSRNRNAGKHLQLFKQRFMQGKRHQPGAGRQYLQAKLLGYLVAKRRRAEPRHRQAAGGDYQLLRRQRFTVNL